MVLVDPGDGLEISGPAGASSLAVLGLERPSVLSESGSGVAAGGAGALLFMVRHPAASSAESVGFSMPTTEGRSTSAH